MKKIGIVGVGIMGAGIAKNFLEHGYSLFVWNRTRSKAEALGKKRVTVCSSPAEVARKSDVVFEITANDQSSRAVWGGKGGILAGARHGTILVASATLSIDWTDELIARCHSSGLTFLDIALTGGRIGAETGTLTLLCGGPSAVLEKMKPALSAISSKVFHFGPEGHGMKYKLILNFLQAVHIVGLGQAMKIAKAYHMDLRKVSDALAERPGGVITGIAQKTYFVEPDPITFSIEWIAKDLTYARRFARKLKVGLLDEVLRVYRKAMKRGYKQ